MSVRSTIHDKLVTALAPAVLEVFDESRMHSVPRGAQTHFKVVVVTEAFAGTSLVQRHRRVNQILADELAGGMHALAIHAYTPQQWTERGGEIPRSPPCLGGSKSG
jgi:BolA protein